MDWQNLTTNAARWEALGHSFLLILVAAIIGLLFAKFGFRLAKHLVSKQTADQSTKLLDQVKKPALLLLPLVALLPIWPWIVLPPALLTFSRHLYLLLFIAAVTWLLLNALFALKVIILNRFDLNVSDNLKARAVYTQINVLVRILTAVICFLALTCLLLTFDAVRQIGLSLLASAGIIGIIIGFAAQRSLTTLLAGIQLAVTQPIRVDDVVIIDGEWGRIEEITLTYVVVRIWDQRRLIVPIDHFLEKTFQNWTRVSAELLGTVYLYTDYRVQVEAIRRQLLNILKQSELWDGRVAGLQVTDCTEKTLVLRALMSAADSSKAWDLRCQVREKLISFLQEKYPDSLPRERAELEICKTAISNDSQPQNAL